MMRANYGFAGKLIECASEALRNSACVDEDKCGGALVDDLQKTRVNRLPDGGALWSLRCWAAGLFFDLADTRHVFDGDFDAKFEGFACACVHDGYRAVRQRAWVSAAVGFTGGFHKHGGGLSVCLGLVGAFFTTARGGRWYVCA